MQVTQTLRRALTLYSDQIAVLDDPLQMTYRQFGDRVMRLAGVLRNLGIGDDDKVAILMLNGHRYLELFYATFWAGGVAVPLNIRLAPPELIFQLNESEAKVLVVDDTFSLMLPAFEGKLHTVRHVVFAGPGNPPERLLGYEQVLADADGIDDAGRGGDDVAGIFYTGGTTGRAKGVMLTHDNIMANAQNTIMADHGSPRDVYLHCAPMFHLADCSGTFGLTMIGAKHAFIPYFEPGKVLEAVERYRVSLLLAIPTMINMLLNHPDFKKRDLSSVRKVSYGAAPIPLALLRQALAELKCEFIQGYGMTELSPLCSMLPPEDHKLDGTPEELKRLRSAGIPIYTAEVRVVDEDDKPLPPGEVGEICARGPMVMKGYWKQPEATAQALRGGWMHTGDAGYIDTDGYLYLVDRTKDMIVTGGENVYSVEVEAALHEHPAVFEAAVIGVPDDQWGEAVHAVVFLKPGKQTTDEELMHHCHALVANYKCPKSISFSSAELPKSPVGKILKRELRKPFWEGRERNIN
ncbi:MAG: long-chain-fatty-acid--CoA ligase [Pirellulales bacterium]|nr:long-chain-fatty-acid--CoA ligase [Pirellulales bacterium]